MRKGFSESFRKNWKGCLGGLILVLVILAVIAAPVLAPYGVDQQSLQDALSAPSFSPARSGNVYILGTDQLGRDLLTRVLYGGRVSLTVGFVAIALSGFLGVCLGLLSGYFGGIVDTIIMRLADIQLAIPSMLLAIVMSTVMGSGLTNIIIVLAITGWVQYARVVRGSTLKVRETEYVEAARSLGAGKLRILFVHILPNVMNSVIVIGTLQMARMILLEASLSFLGLGVNVATPTWGNLISNGRDYITSAWWLCLIPGLAIVIVIMSINLLGEWLRDVLDPQIQ
jgi:peptide/nickel transport system permease protein